MPRLTYEDISRLLKEIETHGSLAENTLKQVMESEDFLSPALFYHAPPTIRDQLITRLQVNRPDYEIRNLLSALGYINDDVATTAIIDYCQAHPEYTNATVNAGWIIEDGKRRDLTYRYARKITLSAQGTPFAKRCEENCPHCGLSLLTITGFRDQDFLPTGGPVIMTMCIFCLYEVTAAYCHVDSGAPIFPYHDCASSKLDPKELEYQVASQKKLTHHALDLSQEVSVVYGTDVWETNVIGGYPGWIQEPYFPDCPECQQAMKFFAQIQWQLVENLGDGTLYFFLCSDCRTGAMQHQQS